MNKTRFFYSWIILQLVVLGGWAAMHEWQRQHAPRVLLKIAPVDPYDIVRGRYQAIAFDVERIPKKILDDSSFGDFSKLERGSPLWIVLRKGSNDWYEVGSVYRERPPTSELVLCARYTYPWSHWDSQRRRSIIHGISASLGINRYFIPARNSDLPRGTDHVILGEVSIGKAGNPQLERLIIDGKPY